MFSGGVCSWAMAKRVVERHGTEGVVLLFADTLMEDEDLYRFLPEAVENVDAEFVRIADGRTPWEVFSDQKMLGNTHADLCSRILKREFLAKWQKENCDPDITVVHFGLDWTEINRLERMRPHHKPWQVEAYMTEEPFMDKGQMIQWLKAEGIEPPRLYAMGFHHNNCGGFCVKSGQAQFELLLRTFPKRYAEHEAKEKAWREQTGEDYAILRDRRGGDTKPLTLEAFRKRLQRQPELFDQHEWGGCGCAT